MSGLHKGLTLKQKKFVREYLKDFNATQACLRAGYDCSHKSAGSMGAQLLNNAKIQDYLEKCREDIEQRIELSTDDIIEEVTELALSANITDFVQILNGRALLIKDFSELTQAQKNCISSIKEGMHGIEVKLHDKLKLLEMLARWSGMDKQTTVHQGAVPVQPIEEYLKQNEA